MNGFGQRPRRNIAPVNVGDELDVKIEAVGEKGDGVAKKKGFVLFVPNTQVNEEVHIRVTKVLEKVGFAESTGPAQGPIEADEPPRRESSDVFVPIEDTKQERETEKFDTSLDSEDFGEESEDDDQDDDLTEEDAELDSAEEEKKEE